jgi:hypothetical protein
MKKFVMLAAAAAVLSAPTLVKAEEAAPAAAEAPAAEVTVVENELADGTKVVVKGEEVFVVGADGAETPAPDGTHTFKDGTTATTKDGKLVK